MAFIVPQNGVQEFMIDGGGELVWIIMNEVPIDQDSPGVISRPCGSFSRSVS